MSIQVGDKIPSLILQQKTDDKVIDISTDEIFEGMKVVLFALPGAFTPTCSAAHLPGFIAKADEFKAKGVDRIVCLSVNDAHVMKAWGEQQNVEDRIMMIADGSGHFTHAVNLELDRRDGGMGIRSQRYAMIVIDGVIEALNVEAPMKFEVSDADTMLQCL